MRTFSDMPGKLSAGTCFISPLLLRSDAAFSDNCRLRGSVNLQL